MANKGLLIASVMATTLLSGCASMFNTADSDSYGCPGMPKGITCATPTQVYNATNEPSSKKGGTVSMPGIQTTAVNGAGGHAGVGGSRATEPAYGGGSVPQPIREPAQVMRIWIAPWTDKDDDLHWPSYLYTEIVPRKWSVGKPDFASMRALVVPHRGMSTTLAAPPSADASGKKSSVPAAPVPIPAEAGDTGATSEMALPAPDSILLN